MAEGIEEIILEDGASIGAVVLRSGLLWTYLREATKREGLISSSEDRESGFMRNK